ncbi:hypothetical protein GCM10019016_094620 [Streptomyces prasinosporus]|uniref:Siderophore-interacting FAD-binding domain-containing protein n=1 Tax=Streptomyces prasinosporus TaxID=68256 RepID=A0ABP6U3V9_9ACTN
MPLELATGGGQGWRELPDDVRAVMRSYTLRALRADALGRTAEIDVDFVLHGVGAEAGPVRRGRSGVPLGRPRPPWATGCCCSAPRSPTTARSASARPRTPPRC